MMRKSYFFKQRLFAAILTIVFGVCSSYASDVQPIIWYPASATQSHSTCAFDASYEDPYCTVQCIYTAEELNNQSGNITSIAYSIGQAGKTYSPTMKVYMGVTSKDGFTSSSDAFTATQLTLVYDGAPTLGGLSANTWDELTLQHSFYYNGEDNLVIAICTSGTTADMYAPAYKIYYETDGKTRQVMRSSESDASYANINVTSKLTCGDFLPCVKLTLGDASTVSEVTIGAGSTDSELAPYDCGKKYSVSQSLYTMGELNGAGKITALSYNVGSASVYAPEEIKIYMGQKGSLFTDTKGLSSSDLTLVYTGTNVPLGKSTGWETITLDKPYNYLGNENLVVVVCKKATSTNANLKYLCTSMVNNQYFLVYDGDSESDADVTKVSTYSAYCTRPNIKFTKQSTSSDEVDTDVSTLSNAIYSDACNTFAGKTFDLPVNVKNTDISNATTLQFDMYLPDQITVAQVDDDYDVSISSTRTTAKKHNILACAEQSDGAIRVMLASSTNATFSGNDGQVLSIPLVVDSDISAGDYKIAFKNCEIGDSDGKSHVVDDINFTLTINDYMLGDVNSDSKITAADISAMVNVVLGKSEKNNASDVNGDSKVSAADISALVNIILGK